MAEQETLFDMAPRESSGVTEQTEIEYLQLAFADDRKKLLRIMMEYILNKTKYDVYPDLLYDLVKDKYEKIDS